MLLFYFNPSIGRNNIDSTCKYDKDDKNVDIFDHYYVFINPQCKK